MRRNLRVLGLAFVAIFAMSAVAAAGAQAEEGKFNWAAGTVKLTASAGGIQEFTTTAGTVKCNEVSGEVDVSNLTPPVSTLTAQNIVYKNNGEAKCPLEPFGKAEIQMHSCDYLFHAGTTLNADETQGTVDIKCSVPGDSITVVAPLGACTIHIPEQTGLGPVTYKRSTTTPEDVSIIPAITNIHYTHEGFSCGSGSGTTGKYVGNVTVKGENSKGAQTSVWVE